MSMKVTKEQFIGVTYEELLAENAKLREEIEAAKHDLQVFSRGSVQLEAENDKLRELVSGLEHCSQGFACDCCPLYDQSNTNHHGCESLERELGVDTGDAID